MLQHVLVLFLILVPIFVLYLVFDLASTKCIIGNDKVLLVSWSIAILLSGVSAWMSCNSEVLCCCKPLADFALVTSFSILSLIAEGINMMVVKWVLFSFAVLFSIRHLIRSKNHAWILTLPQIGILIYLGSLFLGENKDTEPKEACDVCSLNSLN